MDVPVSDIKVVDIGVSAEQGTITAAVESLRRDGVVTLRQAIRQPLLGELCAMVSNWHRRFLNGEIQNYSLGEETATIIPDLWQDAFTEPRELQGFRKWTVAGLDKRVLPLVDSSPLYDVVHAFVGPDLLVTKTQMIVVPSGCLDSPFLHTDAGSMADIVESMTASPLMVSVQIFLSDLPKPGMGNFTCVPGSHQQRFPWSPDNPTRSQLTTTPLGTSIPAEIRRQLLVAAGDVVIFLRSLWHGVTTNSSPSNRLSVILSYAKSFVRPYDYETIPQPLLDFGTRRQRLLFGDLGGWSWRPGCFYHLPDDYFTDLLPDAARTR